MSAKGNMEGPLGGVCMEVKDTKRDRHMDTPACAKDGKIPIPGRIIQFFSIISSCFNMESSFGFCLFFYFSPLKSLSTMRIQELLMAFGRGGGIQLEVTELTGSGVY